MAMCARVVFPLILITFWSIQGIIANDDEDWNDDNQDTGLLDTSDLQPRIASGSPAMLGDAPYHMQVRYLDEYLCGASLVISPNGNQIVITSCECVAEKKKNPQILPVSGLAVFGGRIRRNGWHFFEQYQYVDKVLCHPEWRRDPVLAHDIAVIHIRNEFEINRIVQPIALPIYTDVDPTGYLIITGWGQTHHSSTALAEELQIAHLEIVNKRDCNGEYKHIYGRTVVERGAFCAGKLRNPTYQGACVGDNGSPAVAEGNTSYYLAGIFSWGQPKCGNRYQPSVFTSVSFYLSWILQASWPNQSTRSVNPSYPRFRGAVLQATTLVRNHELRFEGK